MKMLFICPFELNQLTGTPIRAKTTIKAAGGLCEASAISRRGRENVFIFSLHSIKSLIKSRPKIVHGFTTLSIIPILIYKLLFNWKVKIVFESHGWAWFELKKENILIRLVFVLLDLIAIKIADAVIAMSHTQKKFLAGKTNEHKISVLWGPVDYKDDYRTLPEHGGVRVGYLGNGSWWQGLPNITGAAQLLQSEKDISFALAGFDPSDEEKYPRLKNIKYFGKIERSGVFDFLRSSDVLISSRLKGETSDLQFPHKLAEYLSAGRPVIVSGVSDQPEIIYKAKCGFVVDPMTPSSLARAISDFARIPYEERKKLGKNSHDFAQKHFFIGVFSGNLKKVYDGLSA